MLTAMLGHPADDEALVFSDGECWSYGELSARVAAVRLELGDLRGRAVAVAWADPRAWLVDALAVFAAGGVLVPVNAGQAEERRRGRLARLGVAAVRGGQPPTWPERRWPADVALALGTSGSSGVSKTVLLPRAGILANVDAILSYLPVRRGTRIGVVLPPWYSYALVGQLLTALRAGATVIWLSDLRFATEQVAALTRFDVHGVSSVPTSLGQLLEVIATTDTPPPLRWLASAGAPMRHGERLRAALPGALLFDQYGLTEASPRVGFSRSDEAGFAEGWLRPLPGVEVEARHDDGSAGTASSPAPLYVRSPSAMRGYLDDPAGTARVLGPRGLRTGDLGWTDGPRFRVLGREDDLVKVGGERVGLVGVAAQLIGSGLARDAVVVGVPHEATGTRLVAHVCTDDLGELRRWANRTLAPAERPRRWVVCDALPTNENGKLDRQLLTIPQ